MTLNQWLRTAGLPRLEARMLLQHIGGYTRIQMVTQDDAQLPPDTETALDQAAERRRKGEPMAYILGSREFYGRSFAVNPSVLIPRPETEHLVEAVLQRLPQDGRVWDLGTGSGAVAVTVKLERPDAAVRASDISAEALSTARQNAQSLGADIELLHGSWFAAAPETPSENRFNIIVSNPPYIEQNDPHLKQGDLRFEPQTALTDFSDGTSHIRHIAANAPEHLKRGGYLLFEHGFDQGSAVRRILAENGFTDIQTLPDLAGLDRITLGKIPDTPSENV